MGERRMNAYWYSFDETGADCIDDILEAVAIAGKRFHNTEEWGGSGWESDEGSETCEQSIQKAGEKGARVVADLQADNERLLTALGHSVVALDDWLHQYASEECNSEDAERTWARIRENGGTLAYIAQVQERNRAARPGRTALNQPEKG